MALSSSDKHDIEVLIRKEIKDFLGSNTVKQFEETLMDNIAKELKRGKLEKETKEIVLRAFREFYSLMWNNRSYWETRIKNA
jgi:hypothetical protein